MPAFFTHLGKLSKGNKYGSGFENSKCEYSVKLIWLGYLRTQEE